MLSLSAPPRRTPAPTPTLPPPLPHPALSSTSLMQPPSLASTPRPCSLDPGPVLPSPRPQARAARRSSREGRQGAGRHPLLSGPHRPAAAGEGSGGLTSLELRLPRTYLARARGGSGSSRSSSGGSRRRSAGARGGSIPPASARAPLRLPLGPATQARARGPASARPRLKGPLGAAIPSPSSKVAQTGPCPPHLRKDVPF